MSLPTDIAAMEAAVIAWVVAATAMPEDSVRWARQASPRPTGAYVELNAQALRVVGIDWVETRDNPLVFADKAVTAVDTALNRLTIIGHGFATGDGPVRGTTSGTLPGGLTAGTDYWVIRTTADTISLASSHVLALALTAIDITSAGTGSHAIADTADTRAQGAEIQRAVRGVRELSLGVQVFGGPTGKGFGTAAPIWILNSLIASLTSDTHADALVAVGLGFQQADPLTAVERGLGQGLIEARAVTRIRFGVTTELIGTATYIELVEVTDQTRGVTYEIG